MDVDVLLNKCMQIDKNDLSVNAFICLIFRLDDDE